MDIKVIHKSEQIQITAENVDETLSEWNRKLHANMQYGQHGGGGYVGDGTFNTSTTGTVSAGGATIAPKIPLESAELNRYVEKIIEEAAQTYSKRHLEKESMPTLYELYDREFLSKYVLKDSCTIIDSVGNLAPNNEVDKDSNKNPKRKKKLQRNKAWPLNWS